MNGRNPWKDMRTHTITLRRELRSRYEAQNGGRWKPSPLTGSTPDRRRIPPCGLPSRLPSDLWRRSQSFDQNNLRLTELGPRRHGRLGLMCPLLLGTVCTKAPPPWIIRHINLRKMGNFLTEGKLQWGTGYGEKTRACCIAERESTHAPRPKRWPFSKPRAWTLSRIHRTGTSSNSEWPWDGRRARTMRLWEGIACCRKPPL